MTLPNFLIIGSGKGGTSSLYFYLKAHPQIFMSPIKEPNFFCYDEQEPGVLEWGASPERAFPVRDVHEYKKLFADADSEVAIGEASVVYLESRDAPRKIHELLPNVRLVVSLRNPIDRAYSGYWMSVRNGRDSRSVEEALHPDSNLVRAGFYYRLLKRYLEIFGRERMKIVLFDDLKSEPLSVARALFQFLDVDESFEPDVSSTHNPGGAPRSALLNSILQSSAVRAVVSPFLVGGLRKRLRSVRQMNFKTPPPIPDHIRTRLADLYADDISQLGNLLGRDLSHWTAH